jgi:hypothetical protein
MSLEFLSLAVSHEAEVPEVGLAGALPIAFQEQSKIWIA